MNSYKTRHATAMLMPEGEHEQSIANLIGELSRVADRYKGDRVMVPAVVEPLAKSIIGLCNGTMGRLDQGLVDKQVREIVESAGGDANEV